MSNNKHTMCRTVVAEGNIIMPEEEVFKYLNTTTSGNSDIVNTLVFDAILVISNLVNKKGKININCFDEAFTKCASNDEVCKTTEEFCSYVDNYVTSIEEKAIKYIKDNYKEDLEFIHKSGIEDSGIEKIKKEITRATLAAQSIVVNEFNKGDLYLNGISLEKIDIADTTDSEAYAKNSIYDMLNNLKEDIINLITNSNQQLNITVQQQPFQIPPENMVPLNVAPGQFITQNSMTYVKPIFSDALIQKHFRLADCVIIPSTEDPKILEGKLKAEAEIIDKMDIAEGKTEPSVYYIDQFFGTNNWLAELTRGDLTMIPVDPEYRRIICSNGSMIIYGMQPLV